MCNSAAESKPLTTGRTLDHAAGSYDLLAPVMMLGMEGRISRKALELLSLSGNERVLDVGCGTGTLTIEIARHLDSGTGARSVGIDAAPKMIEVAARKGKEVAGVSFRVEAAEQLSSADESFDRVVSTFFFHHISYPLKVRALNEMHRVMVDGAVAVIVDVDKPTNAWGALCAWAGYLLFQQNEIKENIRGRLTDAFSESNFKDWTRISHHGGYISVFRLVKKNDRKKEGGL